MLPQKEINDLLSGKFVLDFTHMVFTQNQQESPKTYKGPGSICQDEEGQLQLKAYHSYQDDEEMSSDFHDGFEGMNISAGTIIDDHFYYKLEALDSSGRYWEENQIWPQGNYSFPTKGRVIKSTVDSICNISNRSGYTAGGDEIISMVIPGTHKFPYHKPVVTSGGGSSLSECVLNVLGYECSIRKEEGYTTIIAKAPAGSDPKKYSDLLLESLSIAVGSLLRPLIRQYTLMDKQICWIYSKAEEREHLRMLTPIPARLPSHAENLNNLVSCYISSMKDGYSHLFGYWYRVMRANNGEMENSALVLTTAIEGIIKKYYKTYGKPDQEILNQVEEAEKALRAVEIGDRVRQRIQGSLRGVKDQSPKGALRDLAENKIINDGHLKVWVKLRNQSAHADELKKDKAKLQAFLNNLHACMELFYRLILNHIKYTGAIIKYSEENWPEGGLFDALSRGSQ